jgi:hypothetical protein
MRERLGRWRGHVVLPAARSHQGRHLPRIQVSCDLVEQHGHLPALLGVLDRVREVLFCMVCAWVARWRESLWPVHGPVLPFQLCVLALPCKGSGRLCPIGQFNQCMGPLR